MTPEQLREIAFGYDRPASAPVVRECLERPRIGPDRNLVRYPELTAIPMLKRFDDYMELICSELAKARVAAGTVSPGDAAQAVEKRIAQEMTL